MSDTSAMTFIEEFPEFIIPSLYHHSLKTFQLMNLTSKYLKGDLLGEGTWGSVFSAERRTDSLKVAIKRIKPMYVHLGVNFTALREIKYLRYIKGPNIIDVSLFCSSSKLSSLFTY